MNTEALLLGIFAVLTDLSDGYLARRLNQISEWGKIIDPLADKVFVGISAICLVWRGSLPLWFVIAVLGRDLIILLGGLYAGRRIKMVIPSNYVGKATVIVLSIVLAAAVIEYRSIVNVGMWVALVAMLYSLYVYGKGMFEKIKEAKNLK